MSTIVFDGATATAAGPKEIEAARLAITARARSGANWFFWIAGLSIINSVLLRTGAKMQFIVGLGTTQLADGIGQAMKDQGAAAAGAVFSAVVSAFMVALFVIFGAYARKRAKWAFYVGMGIYAVDALLFLWVKDFLGIGFHAFVLYCLYKGLVANGELQKLELSLSPMAVQTGPAPIG